MQNNVTWDDRLSNEELSKLAIDMFHRIVIHHALWFNEVRHQLGFQEALKTLDTAFQKSFSTQMKRFAKLFGFEMEKGIPKPLLDMSREKLLELLTNTSINWLANDGIWFQAVEFKHGMNDAKRCNDSCWTKFSPFEADSIKRFLGLPEKAGIEGLKQALQFRMYARINVQSIIDEGPNSIVFQMNDCRVQAARKRQGLEDYPCKSAGLVEYSQFAKTIDPRIQTECIGCPPDAHPEEWFCAWRFTLVE
ncbi:conserved hypothetical cytosolic protein [Desulforamulus reducens MI-1]|uniref:Conserved hypothetical cytosolic protein n=1 Tax=Desulforamulus reducens (strain ATCC BAA-1160 / DSM 100696 / MI-1) TaxID=349161 RepID=A4J5D8_DESRM|nr:DUF6125 family protein [Desulforamulus reducens]ABO50291.1 conserved hypothetical cytosolic protein [Desulforamulus reducens MI-1]